MCGVWGYIGSETGIPLRDAWIGLRSLTDRGPDDWGMYVEGEGKITEKSALPQASRRVVLGNRRLSILDLSPAGNQPMGSEENGLWIVYNGEIYNYREIRERLHDRGYTFESNTDTEVILRAYQEFGEECVEQFRGMFAFGIYDTARRELFAARDRFGIKPFYYDVTGDRLAFASEVTSLLESGISEKELDNVSVDGFLTLGYVPGPRTIVEGVRSLPAGSILRYDADRGDCKIRSYWTPEFGQESSSTADRVRDLLKRSVRLRLRSDVPVGAFLSGGLDSSSIVALMREVADEGKEEDLHTFSIGFDDDAYSETAFAETVAQEFGTTHTSRRITAEDVREELDDIMAAMDQPTIDGVNTYFVSKLAADEGLKVVLSGLGSDELLFGYPSFRRVPKLYRAARALYTIPSWIRRPIAQAIDRIGAVVPGLPTGKVADGVRSDSPFGAAYLTERGIFTTSQRQALMRREPRDWGEVIERDIERTLTESNVENAVSEAELTWYMCEQLLRDTDTMSMSHSLEVRVPFLDSGFAEYVMGTKGENERTGEKLLLKDAMRDTIPLEVIEREKSGFTFPFADWLRNDLNDIVDRALVSSSIDRSPLSSEAIESMRQRFERGNLHWSRLWALVVLSLWMEEHLES